MKAANLFILGLFMDKFFQVDKTYLQVVLSINKSLLFLQFLFILIVLVFQKDPLKYL